ncbi:MAG: hypothetical protein A2729_00715 [Candidatus Buchananbacteria bacterium RIFCSPHIGHO2_01_FULL_39_14]|uniref:HD domain-containing protein n=2 Tax=Candidatus Buchananiibacteriota TaxID=1817903 RepID=A0A1G1YQE4_9BACT|nr:MAG: hypothetical protein A2729_00715 [Candidatus Buchananbacteria bacterium RIFCSPHIGHO2_01_FULL_39_14]OGY48685.1 MAG: hypothetical protein A3D39_04390 [Candidatus Buchananbacteria bacterium RIFCSPHIGHO2_02_FULL_39_17]OGY54541.1 MAG: hypothetical protein A2912_00325 [Candidatus Buchananbacteria bacterium RIFCSPLOWO2_01_FULL_40_23b]
MNPCQKQLQNWSNQPFAKQLARRYPKAEIFLVGGAVRDLMLDRPTKDFDFVIREVNKNDLENFLKKFGKVDLVGKRFGVFKFKPRGWTGEEIDIALPRTEHSLNFSGAYRDFKIQSKANLKIEDDLSRRDFTINAMAIKISQISTPKAHPPRAENLKSQNYLVDPFGGLNDLNKKIIRTVGKPELRFKEDYSRMLRAIRFACQLNFQIESKTWQVIKKQIKNLNKKIADERVVAYEIIAKELTRAFSANPVLALELLNKSGAIKNLFPELLKMKNCPQPKNWHSEGDVWTHTILALTKLNSTALIKEFDKKIPSAEVIWSLIFHDLGKPFTITHEDRIRFSGHEIVSVKKFREISEQLKLASTGLNVDVVEKIIAKHMILAGNTVSEMKDTTIEKYFFNPNFPGTELLMAIYADILATVPPNGQPDFSNYKKLKNRINKIKKTTRAKNVLPKPLVDGNDLMKTFKLTASPKIGKLLGLLREAQLRGKVKSKTAGLKYIKKYL